MSLPGHEAPTEIIEIILSHLRNDFPTLVRCSLVDRGWLSMSRRWLFEDVDMASFRTTSRQARFHKFMDLFEKSRPTAPCTLNQHVQCLTLDPTFTPYQISGLATLDLPSLHAIRIKASSVSVPRYLLSSISTIFSEKIRHLDITSVVFPAPLAFVEFVAGFPHLEHLALGDNVFDKGEWHPPATRLQLSPRITSLRWSQRLGIIMGEVRGWLLDHIKQQEIEVKFLEFVANGWCDDFPSDVFATVAEKVEQLDIHLNFSDYNIIDSLTSVNTSFLNLRHLHLKCPLENPQSLRYQPGSLNLALTLLASSLVAPQLSDLFIACSAKKGPRLCAIHTLRETPFKQFDEALCAWPESGSLPTLRTVRFLAENCPGHPCLGAPLRFAEGNSNGRVDDGSWEGPGGGSETFEDLASEFLENAFPRTLAAKGLDLFALQVVNW